jgi:hypothetical protein
MRGKSIYGPKISIPTLENLLQKNNYADLKLCQVIITYQLLEKLSYLNVWI